MSSIAKSQSQPKKDVQASYNRFKEFGGKELTGMTPASYEKRLENGSHPG